MFNKKLEQRVEGLEMQFQTICRDLTEIRKEIKEPKCFGTGSDVPEDTILSYFGKHLGAIEDYLKIKITWDWEDDSNFPPPEPKKIRAWRAKKC